MENGAASCRFTSLMFDFVCEKSTLRTTSGYRSRAAWQNLSVVIRGYHWKSPIIEPSRREIFGYHLVITERAQSSTRPGVKQIREDRLWYGLIGYPTETVPVVCQRENVQCKVLMKIHENENQHLQKTGKQGKRSSHANRNPLNKPLKKIWPIPEFNNSP